MDEMKGEFLAYMKEKGKGTEQETLVAENNIILVNRYDDFWFWPVDVLASYKGSLGAEIFNYFHGITPLSSPVRIACFSRSP